MKQRQDMYISITSFKKCTFGLYLDFPNLEDYYFSCFSCVCIAFHRHMSELKPNNWYITNLSIPQFYMFKEDFLTNICYLCHYLFSLVLIKRKINKQGYVVNMISKKKYKLYQLIKRSITNVAIMIKREMRFK